MSLDLMKEISDELTKALLERIKSGEATAADFSVARQYLKDNNVTVNLETDGQMTEIEERLKRQRKAREKSQLSQQELDEAGNVIDMMGRANSK